MREVCGWWRSSWARAAYVVGGVFFAALITSTAPTPRSQAWAVWAATAIGLAATSGAVFGYALAQWSKIAMSGSIRGTRVAGFVGQNFAVAGVMIVGGASLPGAAASAQGYLLTLLPVLAALPVVADFAAVRELAVMLHGTAGEQFERILSLLRVLSGLLTALGGLVALTTLTIGAQIPLLGGPTPGLLVIFGAAGCVLVALSYVPPANAVRESARALCATIAPIADSDGSELRARVDDRAGLERVLGLDRSLLADFQSGVIVLAPLLASAAVVFLPH